MRCANDMPDYPKENRQRIQLIKSYKKKGTDVITGPVLQNFCNRILLDDNGAYTTTYNYKQDFNRKKK